MKKTVFISAGLLLVLMFVVLIASVLFVVFNQGFYDRECRKIGSDCKNAINVLDYLKNKEQLSEEFSVRERDHMKDVKIVIYSILAIGLFFALTILVSANLVFFYNRKKFRKFVEVYLLYGGIFSFFVIIAMMLLTINKFDFLFIVMHKLLFKEGTWIFNEEDVLIKAFPEQFFLDFGVYIFTIALISSTILIILGLLIKKFK